MTLSVVAQTKGERYRAEIDSVVGKDIRLRRWWPLPNEVKEKGGEVLEGVTWVLTAHKNLLRRDFEELCLQEKIVRCIVRREHTYDIALIAENRNDTCNLYWATTRGVLFLYRAGSCQLSLNEWNTFMKLLKKSSLAKKGIGDTIKRKDADMWTVESYMGGDYHLKSYPFGGDMCEAVFYLLERTDLCWTRENLLRSFLPYEAGRWPEKCLDNKDYECYEFKFHFYWACYWGLPIEMRVERLGERVRAYWRRGFWRSGNWVDCGEKELPYQVWEDMVAACNTAGVLEALDNRPCHDSFGYEGSELDLFMYINGKKINKWSDTRGNSPLMRFFRSALSLTDLCIGDWELQ